ncbi:MAG: hypothetical protein RL660_3083 [Bacteroidota bacterium]|jgi:hypothetical protein
MKRFLHLLYATLLCLLATQVNAQSISYPSPASDLTICHNSGLLTVSVTGADPTTETVTVDLADGIEYIPGSFSINAGSGTVTENISNLNEPIFTITSATSPITFSLERKATCGTFSSALGGGTFKDAVTVGTVIEANPLVNFYEVVYPTLTITAPTALTNVGVGTTHIRTFTFQNNGQGCLDTAFLTIDYAGIGLSPNGPIVADGVSFTADPTLSNATTKVYKIYGTPTMVGGLCDSDPAISVSEPVLVSSCDQGSVGYALGWGCNATAICATTNTTGNFTALTTNPTLNIVVTNTLAGGAGCAGAPYATFTAVVKNNGTGPASNVNFRIGNTYVNSFTPNREQIIDTASILVNGTHPAVVVDASMLIVKENGVTPDCAVGQPGMASALAGITLAVGDSIVVTWNVNICSDGGICNEGHYFSEFMGIAPTYENECGAQIVGNFQGYPFGPINYIPSATPQMPAQVTAGSCFKVTVDVAASLGPNIGGFMEAQITLPMGMTIANLASDVTEDLNNAPPLPGYPQQVGQVVTTRFVPGTANVISFVICTPATGACGVQSFPIEISMTNDTTCASGNRLVSKKCFSASTSVICAQPCPTGGVNPYEYSFYRTSYGLPDNNQDGFPDLGGAIDLNKIDLDRYQPGDTLHTVYKSEILDQTAPSSITLWNNVYAEWSLNNGTWEGITANVTIRRAGIDYVATGVALTTLTAGRTFRLDWSAATFSPALPSAGYVAGDSLTIEADLRYAPPAITSGHSVGAGDPSVTHSDAPIVCNLSHTVYATQTVPSAAYSGIDQFTCFVPEYAANVIGQWNFMFVYPPTSATGCNTAEGTFISYQRRLRNYTSTQFFLYEYRPQARQDSVIVNVPAGWEYVGANTANNYEFYTPKRGVNARIDYTVPVTVTGNASTGLKLVYDFAAAYASGGLLLGSEDFYVVQSYILRPSCATPANTTTTAREYGHFVSYPSSTNGAAYTSDYFGATTYSGTNRPDIIVNNNSGVVQAASATNNYWDIQITGANANVAKYIWLATEKLAGSGISILSVEYPIGTPLAISSNYGVDKNLYQIDSVGLVNPQSDLVRIYFNKSTCAQDSIKLRVGWDCSAFPTTADNACSSKDQFLKATSATSEIQLLKITEPAPGTTVDICSPINYKVRVRSTQNGDLDNPNVLVTVPVGTTVVGNSFTYYYAGDNNPEVFVVAPVGRNYTLNLEDHSLMPASGLKGVANAANVDERTAFIEFQVQVNDCKFVSGGVPRFTIFGDKVCGGTAIGNGLVIRGRPIKATPQGTNVDITQTLGIAPAVLECGTQGVVTATITSVDGNTYDGDSVIYTMPAGLRYISGSLSVSGAFASTSETDTSIVVRFTNTTNNTATITYNVEPTNSIGCSVDPLPIYSQVFRSRGFSCPLTFGTCQIAEITSDDSVTVTINKPQLTVQSFTMTENAGIINYDMTIENTGTQDAAAGAGMINIYCASVSGTLLHSFNTDAVAVGSTTTQSGSFSYSSSNCPAGNLLFALVQDTLANGTTACLCENASGKLSTNSPLAIALMYFTGKALAAGTNELQWQMAAEDNVAYYEVLQRTSTQNNFEVLTKIPYSASNKHVYKISHATATGNDFYKLRMVDNNGKILYSNVVNIINVKSTATQYQLIPNQTNTSTTLRFASRDGEGEIVVIVRDIVGRIVKHEQFAITPGDNAIQIDLQHMLPGQYLIQYNNLGSNESGVLKCTKVD